LFFCSFSILSLKLPLVTPLPPSTPSKTKQSQKINKRDERRKGKDRRTISKGNGIKVRVF